MKWNFYLTFHLIQLDNEAFEECTVYIYRSLETWPFFHYTEINQTNKVIEKKWTKIRSIGGFVGLCAHLCFFFALPLNIFSRIVFIDINKQSTVISIQLPFIVNLPEKLK